MVGIPQHAIIFNDYNLAFIEHFIIHHIYRINKLIIDNDDFTTFKNEIDFFCKTLQFKDPKIIARDIDASLYPHNFGLLDEEVSKYCDKLQFIINYKSMKDFNQVFEFQKELENYTNLILSKIQDDNQKELEKEKLIGLNKNIVEFYISSLLYGVFFKIACYIISKGENYLHYLKELWYHTEPQEKSFHNILNTTPISEDVDWNVLYSIYGGKGSRIYDDIDFFDDFQDYQIYFHQYAILNMLKHTRIIRIPSIDEISTIDNKGRTYLLDYFYDLVYGFKEDDFLNALETIKNTKFTSLIRLKKDETIENRISDVRNLLEETKKNKEKVIDEIVSMKTVIKEKLDTYLNQIKKEYFERSVADHISHVTYDPSIAESEFKIIQGNYSMKREHFVEPTINIDSVIFGPGTNMSFPEINYVFEIIKNSEIKIISENTKDFLTQIEKSVKYLRDLGYDPDSMFIPINVEHKLRLKNWQIFTTSGLKIDNQEIRTINSWKKFPFDEIIIFDSKCLNIKYQSDKKDNRLSFEIGDTKKGLKIIEIIASLKLIVNIKDAKGFIKIFNDEAKKDVK